MSPNKEKKIFLCLPNRKQIQMRLLWFELSSAVPVPLPLTGESLAACSGPVALSPRPSHI